MVVPKDIYIYHNSVDAGLMLSCDNLIMMKRRQEM